jgi:hypothetical protein
MQNLHKLRRSNPTRGCGLADANGNPSWDIYRALNGDSRGCGFFRHVLIMSEFYLRPMNAASH